MEKSKTIELLYDHYKDTFFYIQTYRKYRDKMFLYLMISLIFSVIFFQNPTEISQLIINFINTQYKLNLTISFNIINSLILLLLLSFTIKYFQSNLLLERQYDYIHKLEDEFQKNKFIISREGKSYNEDYPFLLTIIDRIYKIIIPIIIVCLLIYKFRLELKMFCNSPIFGFFNLVIIFINTGFIIIYTAWINFRNDPNN